MNIKMVYSFIFKWPPEGLLMFYCFVFFPFVFFVFFSCEETLQLDGLFSSLFVAEL